VIPIIEEAALRAVMTPDRAVAAMRDVGMSDDQINEALGRHDPEPATFQRSPETPRL
jgi:hypothetical protein